MPYCRICGKQFSVPDSEIRLTEIYYLDKNDKIQCLKHLTKDGVWEITRDWTCYSCFPKEAEDKLSEQCITEI